MYEKILKRIVAIFLFFVTILLLTPFVFDYLEPPKTSTDTSKKVEIIGSSISGYRDNALSWRVFADYVWAGKSRYIFRAERVSGGFMLNQKGEVVIDSLKADYIRINSRSKTIVAQGNIGANFYEKKPGSRVFVKGKKKLFADEKQSENEKPVKITSDELRYFGDTERLFLSKNVKIEQDDATIYPHKGVDINNKKNMAYINDGFTMISDEFNVSGNKMVIDIDSDKSIMNGNILFTRVEKKDFSDKNFDEREKKLRASVTTLSCERANYSEKKDKHYLEVYENVHVIQEDKEIFGDSGVYNEETGIYIIEGNVKIILNDLAWMLTNETKEDIGNEDMNSTLSQETVVTAKTLVFQSDSRELTLFGDVKVVQPDKTITADRLFFDDKQNKVICTGRVLMVKDAKDTIKSDYLEIDIKNEIFTALDRVSTEYHIKD